MQSPDQGSPEGLLAACALCATAGAALVTGTTGLGEAHERALTELGTRVAVLRASNFSLGVLALRRAVQAALAALPKDWDVEIVERHHRQKADAPSGTALALGDAAARGRGTPIDADRGRDGTGLKRREGSIGFAAIRGGTVAGDHDVMFLGPDERLILSHRAENRSIFARGALAAARFLHGKPAGLYSMRDVIEAA